MGNVFWIENNALKESSHTESHGGKGGGGKTKNTTYSYSATFALGLCEGPITGVRRIWISGKLIYDAGSDDMGTIQASNQASSGFRIYLGDESQTPDSRMQATLGVANTPAYRGLAYIVFYDLALAEYSNSLMSAQVKVEVVRSGSDLNRLMTYTNVGISTAIRVVWDGTQFIAINQVANTSNYSTSPDGLNWTVRSAAGAAGPSTSVEIATKGGVTLAFWAYQGGVWRTENGLTWVKVNTGAGNGYWGLAKTNSFFLMFAREYTGSTYVSDNGKVWRAGPTLPYPTSYDQKCWATDGKVIAIVKNGYAGVTVVSPEANGTDLVIAYPYPLGTGPRVIAYMPNIGMWFMANQANQAALTSDFINWQTYTMPHAYGPVEYCDALYMAQNTNTQKVSYDGLTWSNVTIPSGLNVYDMAYSSGVGLFLGFSGPSYRMVLNKLVGTSPTLGSIISAECKKSGTLLDADLDVTSLTDPVRGYKLASVAAIRSSLDTLQGAWPFDVVQSGYKLRFKRRGSSTMATVSSSELGAAISGEKEVERFTESREMAIQLPSNVLIGYIDYDREYDMGEQYAERLNTGSVATRAIEMSIVMTANEAVQKAEVLLYMYWLERSEVSFSLPPTFRQLEPADVITVQAESGTYELRLTSIDYQSSGVMDCVAKLNNAAAYSSTAISDTGVLPLGVVKRTVRSSYDLLNIPTILDALDTAGFPTVMSGVVSGWNGGTIFKSTDGGQTWAVVSGFTSQSAMGSTLSNIGAPAEPRLIDKSSQLTVALSGGASLVSVTESQMLNGSNYFAYGVEGRWELIAAQNCVLQGNGTYVLTDLLRGRFGTEWAMGLHVTGDSIYLLDINKTQFSSVNVGTIGLSLDYRGVSYDQSIDEDTNRAFIYTGVNLECLSPVYLNGNRHPSTNDWSLEWLRRTRVGGEWLNNVDALLSEASEAYEVEIYSSGTYVTLKRTITGLTTPNATYTSADQVTDFGSNQATLYLKVYQLSANVGRGYPLTQSITR
jgi:hypothetical protein